ncbi:hypothetical protein OAR04_00575 [Flavobacteriales bacterium]|nr:hypothetical protein [Flavobacteriales bacterium]
MFKNTFLISLLLFVFISCEKDPEPISYSNSYGNGTYILSDNGLNFIKKNTSSLKSEIFSNVNGLSIINPKTIEIYGSKLYIVGDDFYSTDINTLQLLGQVDGFSDPAGCAIVTQNRAFVTDKAESLVKVVDLNDFRIISEIQTGEGTSPAFIINKFDKSFILNGGDSNNYDSTLVTVTYKDDLIPLADISGNLVVGKNPNSAIATGNIKVLCSGVYDENNPSNNIESSFYNIYPSDLLINFSQNLSSIYNANNLVETSNGNNFYFTANGGIYRTNTQMTNVNMVIPIESDVLNITTEKYAVNDTTDAYSNILYMNDLNNSGKIYKYNINLSMMVDTLSVSGKVLDIKFKN